MPLSIMTLNGWRDLFQPMAPTPPRTTLADELRSAAITAAFNKLFRDPTNADCSVSGLCGGR